MRWFVFSGENGFCVLPQQNRLLVARFLYGAHESFPTLRDVCMYVCVCACGCSFNMDG